MRGTVKWFDRKKGYGFVADDESLNEYFFHYTSIVGEGFRKVDEGEKVLFDVIDDDKKQGGKKATHITRPNTLFEGEKDGNSEA